MEILNQKHLFKEITYEIKKDSIHYQSKGLLNSMEYDVSFEEITDKVIFETKIQELAKLAILCCLVLVIAASVEINLIAIIISVSVLALFILLLFTTRKHIATILLTNRRALIFNLKKPDPDTVKEFIAHLQTRIKEYLKGKYGNIDRDLPVEPQLNNFNWLKNRNVISEEEFTTLKNKLLRKESDFKVGFN